jgi:hypothetical protein
MGKVKVLVSLALVAGMASVAQDSTKEKTNLLRFSGFAEAYYSYDFNRPVDNRRPAFFYSYNRHNEFNINLAYVKADYSTERTRASIALAAGTYMNANYAAEPGVLKNIYEADVGVSISKNKSLWVDVGILPSHIGFESAHSPENWVLTRSIIADNTPYFEGGVKITYITRDSKWLLSALALNGWQRIQRVPGNSLMSWGTQVQYKPSAKTIINYSTFLGTDKPDSVRKWRFFHNLYAIVRFNDKWGIIFDVDVGQEQKAKESSRYNTWYGTACVLRFAPNNNWAVALRGEYYSDAMKVIILTPAGDGFKTFGASLNVDRIINSNFLWRTEIRTLYSKDKLFSNGSNPVNNNTAITTSFALTF